MFIVYDAYTYTAIHNAALSWYDFFLNRHSLNLILESSASLKMLFYSTWSESICHMTSSNPTITWVAIFSLFTVLVQVCLCFPIDVVFMVLMHYMYALL